MNGCGHGSSEVALSKAWLKDVITILAREGFAVLPVKPTAANLAIYDEAMTDVEKMYMDKLLSTATEEKPK
jgi:hypothetical protein